MKLSAVLIVKNEERNLRECLASLDFADEIVVVDSGSTDRTPAIAQELSAKVFTRPFDDFSSQKNYALSKASNDWVLSVDADERVPAELRAEILRCVGDSGRRSAFRIPRRTYFLGKRFRFSGTQNDKPVRLFRKSAGRFCQPIHEFFKTDGTVGELKNPLTHFTTDTVAKELAKTEFYTDLEARFLRDKKTVVGGPAARLRAAAVFARLYFFQLGVLDGREGLLFAYYSARYTRVKYAKLRQLTVREQLEPAIEKSFDRHAPKLPGTIDRSDSRLQALLEAAGDVRNKRVLDVGCGKGRFAEVFAERGADVTGIDPSEELLKKARTLKGRFVQGSSSALPFADGEFDVVYAVEVIEHLPLLGDSLKEMARVLKAGGALVLIDRNRLSLNNKRFLVPNILMKRWHELRNHWIYPENFPFHERWFTRNELLRALKPHFRDTEAHHILSDGEKKCAWHGLFERVSAVRHFILWKGIK